MSRKHVVTCGACGRPAARDAMVRVVATGRRGPDPTPWLRVAPALYVCPVCARTRTFRVVAEPAPDGEGHAPPTSAEKVPLGLPQQQPGPGLG